MEKVNKNMYHISSIKSENLLDVSCCSHANQRQGNAQESLLQLDLLLFFALLVKGIQRLFSVRYLFGEANFAQNFLSLGLKFLDDHSIHVQFPMIF